MVETIHEVAATDGAVEEEVTTVGNEILAAEIVAVVDEILVVVDEVADMVGVVAVDEMEARKGEGEK